MPCHCIPLEVRDWWTFVSLSTAFLKALVDWGLQVIYADIDTDASDIFTDKFYRKTGLDYEPLSVQYKSEIFNIASKSKEWFCLETLDGERETLIKIKLLFDEKISHR